MVANFLLKAWINWLTPVTKDIFWRKLSPKLYDYRIKKNKFILLEKIKAKN